MQIVAAILAPVIAAVILPSLGWTQAASRQAPVAVRPSDVPMPPDRLTFANYRCADGRSLEARYLPPSVDSMGRSVLYLSIDGGRVRLVQEPAAEGVRYVGGGWQWRTEQVAAGGLSRLAPGGTVATGPETVCTLG